MRSKRRTNQAITSQILKVCDNGASKTTVVYQANLNFLTAESYLDNLIKNGLIEVIPDGSRVIYKTTAKGIGLKEKIEQFQGLMEDLCAHV